MLQILGEEARARVPEAFVAQHPEAANPPTLFLPLASMAQEVATFNTSANVMSDRAHDIEEQRQFLLAGAT